MNYLSIINNSNSELSCFLHGLPNALRVHKCFIIYTKIVIFDHFVYAFGSVLLTLEENLFVLMFEFDEIPNFSRRAEQANKNDCTFT